MAAQRNVWLLGTALAWGCEPVVTFPDAGDESDGPNATSDVDPSMSASTTIATTSFTSTGGVDDTATTSGIGFLDDRDGGPSFECNLWTDDCGPGFKCMPWASDGGSSWNATKCSPVAPDPGAPGEPCTVEDSAVSGVDDCEAFSMCYGVDPETNAGTCVAFCQGSETEPTCAHPCEVCSLSGSTALALCLPGCDPLLQNCPLGWSCVVAYGGFACVPDGSGDMGGAGDHCDLLGSCDPGLFCANASRFPGCAGSQGCCTPFCAVGSTDPCPGLRGGIECVPLPVDTPPNAGCHGPDVGACLIP